MDNFFITSERYQNLADHFLEFCRDENPNMEHSHKWVSIDFSCYYNNPPYVYIKADFLRFFVNMMDIFMNPVTIISPGTDIMIDEQYLPMLEHPKLKHLYIHNIGIKHDKLTAIPIGIANRMWKHGNLEELDYVMKNMPLKDKDVFFNFTIETNINKRLACYNTLKDVFTWTDKQPYLDYLKELARHKYCICPEGNGYDTHRVWECMYLNVIPIALETPYNLMIKQQYLPNMILIQEWEDARAVINKEYVNPNIKIITFEEIAKKIRPDL